MLAGRVEELVVVFGDEHGHLVAWLTPDVSISDVKEIAFCTMLRIHILSGLPVYPTFLSYQHVQTWSFYLVYRGPLLFLPEPSLFGWELLLMVLLVKMVLT